MTRAGGKPTLLVVSGPPGSGKSTLARHLADRIGCPAVIRDEIKQGMVAATPGYDPSGDDPLNLPARDAFFGVISVLVKAGVTAVAEAAYQDRLWRPGLEPLVGLADIRVIRCVVPPNIAHERIAQRVGTDTHRAAHGDAALLEAIAAGDSPIAAFVPIAMDLPTLTVDTSDGYRPRANAIFAFATSAASHS